jgi:hypothetical protein
MTEAAASNPILSKGQAGDDPYSIPLDKIDVSNSEPFLTDTLWGYFERLRNNACEEILKLFRNVDVAREPERVRSNFVKGYTHLPVRVQPW